MTCSHPLALTDTQLDIVRNHAKWVRPEMRGRFLNDVADRLLPLDPDDVDDYVVQMAVSYALTKFVGVPP